MKKLIVANWKENPASLKKAISLARQIEKGIVKTGKSEVVIAPPFPFLSAVGKVLKRAKLGAQNVFWEDGGAYTGEVSPSMLKNSGVEYVIIGHSERRKLGETDEMVNKKVKASLKAGLKVILCVGEPAERGLTRTSRGLTRNKKSAKNFVKKQLENDLHDIAFSLRKSALIVAYEPIWAIGSGKPDKPEDTVEMAKFIRSIAGLKAKVLYGGSVTSRNAKSFLQYKEVDGALVGGASLKAEELKKITAIANNANKAQSRI